MLPGLLVWLVDVSPFSEAGPTGLLPDPRPVSDEDWAKAAAGASASKAAVSAIESFIKFPPWSMTPIRRRLPGPTSCVKVTA